MLVSLCFFSYSDDGGDTWSKQLFRIPYRHTAIDINNTFANKTAIFWNVDQFKSRNGSVYAMFTKIHNYPQSAPEEGYVLSSNNAMSEEDPNSVVWTLLPDEEHGPTAPRPFNPQTTIAEEWHVIPLQSSPGFFAVFRTSAGILGSKCFHVMVFLLVGFVFSLWPHST